MATSQAPLCAVGEHCRNAADPATGQPLPARKVADRGHLCVPCRNQLARWLQQIPDLAGALPDSLAATGGHGRGGKGRKAEQWPVNPQPLGLTQHTYGVLACWCLLIVEQRGHIPPRVDPGYAGIIPLAAWLTRHVEWVAHRDWSPDMHAEICDLHHRLAHAAYPQRERRRFPLPSHRRTCPDCGGTLYAVIASERHADTRITCDGCDHEWDPTRWFRLGRRILSTVGS